MDELDREAIARLAAHSVARRAGKLRDLEDLEQEARMAIHKAEAKYNPALSDLGPYLWHAAHHACIDWVRATYGRYAQKRGESIGDRDFPLEDHAIELVEQSDSARRAQELLDAYEAEDARKTAERALPRPVKSQPPPRPPRQPRQPLTAGPYQYGLLTYERFGQALMVKHQSGYLIMLPLGDLRHVLDLIEAKEKQEGATPLPPPNAD